MVGLQQGNSGKELDTAETSGISGALAHRLPHESPPQELSQRLGLHHQRSQPLLPGAAWPRERQEPRPGSSRQRRMTLPATRRTIPLVNMLASGRAGLSCMVVVERMVSTTPQTSSTRALSSSTRQSDKPPSCFSSTSRARRQSVVPTASRHSPDRLLVLYSRMMPPIPQHRMDFLGSWNHQSSTCSSRMFLWMWSASAGVRGVLSSASSGMAGGWGGGHAPRLGPHASSQETSPCCRVTSACPDPASSPCKALARESLQLPNPACPTQRQLARHCPRGPACSWCWQRGRTEQRPVPPGIKPHSQLRLHMLPHQHQPLVTNWLCCPE
uniref:Uncharacterized protein n=1 Tax=Anser cygnoides TaxID=8845 RepID=A0A8B9EQQ0_ANSCY